MARVQSQSMDACSSGGGPVLISMALTDGAVVEERNQAAHRHQRWVHHASDSWGACVLMVAGAGVQCVAVSAGASPPSLVPADDRRGRGRMPCSLRRRASTGSCCPIMEVGGRS